MFEENASSCWVDNGLGWGEVTRCKAQSGQAMCTALSQENEISTLTPEGRAGVGWVAPLRKIKVPFPEERE